MLSVHTRVALLALAVAMVAVPRSTPLVKEASACSVVPLVIVYPVDVYEDTGEVDSNAPEPVLRSVRRLEAFEIEGEDDGLLGCGGNDEANCGAGSFAERVEMQISDMPVGVFVIEPADGSEATVYRNDFVDSTLDELTMWSEDLPNRFTIIFIDADGLRRPGIEVDLCGIRGC